MGKTAIRVENLGKQYRIGAHQRGASKYKSLHEELTKAVRPPIRRAGQLLRREAYGAVELDETIWALKDVSFEIECGEAVGIIGRNGAGKTTLLNILCRITAPTEGRAVLHGRVGSLLEMGTGFHPELTGRENIYLNCAILGMRKDEIERKFDEIIDFSGVENFIDTPVKHYSSGMCVRLAFSVAAHLDPEILLIDEVLPVGDAGFQKERLGKMGDVASQGRTVLFVSHDMNAINRLCRRTVLGGEGCLTEDGITRTAVRYYLRIASGASRYKAKFPPDASRAAQVLAVRICHVDGTPVDTRFANTERFLVTMRIVLRERIPDLRLPFYFRDSSGRGVPFSDIRDRSESAGPSAANHHEIELLMPAPLLALDRYTVTFPLSALGGHLCHIRDTVSFELVNLLGSRGSRPGCIDIPLRWEIRYSGSD